MNQLVINIYGKERFESMVIENNSSERVDVYISICDDKNIVYRNNVRAWANTICESLVSFKKVIENKTFVDKLNQIITNDFSEKSLLNGSKTMILGIINDEKNELYQKIIPIF